MNIKINVTKVLGYILFGVGIVGGVESFFYAEKSGESGFGIAAVAMVLIIVGSIFLGMKEGEKK